MAVSPTLPTSLALGGLETLLEETMVQSGSAVFTDPGDYQAGIGIGGANGSLVLTSQEAFKGRLTWLKQRDLYLLIARESVPCIACFSLVPTRTFISFPASSNTALVWGGVALQFGDVVLHSPGERAHQWTRGASTWGLASLPSDQFAAYSKILMEFELTAPPVSRVLRPLPRAISRLRRLHAGACRLAETKPEIHAHTEVVRAIEQEYVHALINCLTAKRRPSSPGRNPGPTPRIVALAAAPCTKARGAWLTAVAELEVDADRRAAVLASNYPP